MRLPPPITSRTNAKVKALRASLSGEARRPGDLLGLEGLKLMKEAHVAGNVFETVYVREGSEAHLDRGWLREIKTQQWMVLSPDVFDSAVGTRSPQGIAATWKLQQSAARVLQGAFLVMEELQDPGNVGTLLRSADAFGYGVMATPGTVNEWNPKVVRASAGSVFRLRMVRAPLEELYRELHLAGFRIFAAVAVFHNEASLSLPHGVIFGRRDDRPGSGGWVDQGEPYSPEAKASSLAQHADFTSPCAIAIGNEGAGLSGRAVELADEQVAIPAGVESLNAGVAGSLLMYEEMRQRELRQWARKQGLRS